jgi:hypothetical protein
LLSLAALRGSPQARVERIKLSRRMTSHQVSQAQLALGDYLDAFAPDGLTPSSERPGRKKAKGGLESRLLRVCRNSRPEQTAPCYPVSNQVQGAARPPGMCHEWS